MTDAAHPSPTLAERVLTAAHELAGKDITPSSDLERELDQAPRPVFTVAATARPVLWAILALPERARAFRWLDRQEVLEELIPCWKGSMARRKLRLGAMEQVHLEVWRPGIDDSVFAAVCDTHDVVVDARLNRWALTALGTLLAGGDVEDTQAWQRFVRRDLSSLGATEAEIVWITALIRDFTPAVLFLRGEEVDVELRPELLVSALSTLALSEPDRLEDARKRANSAMRDDINPLDKVAEEEDD